MLRTPDLWERQQMNGSADWVLRRIAAPLAWISILSFDLVLAKTNRATALVTEIADSGRLLLVTDKHQRGIYCARRTDNCSKPERNDRWHTNRNPLLPHHLRPLRMACGRRIYRCRDPETEYYQTCTECRISDSDCTYVCLLFAWILTCLSETEVPDPHDCYPRILSSYPVLVRYKLMKIDLTSMLTSPMKSVQISTVRNPSVAGRILQPMRLEIRHFPRALSEIINVMLH